ncbi:MAG: energy-coupling factor transporter transmembrane component T [Syntrophales bacterium]|nr:energy-coupling factor transporter transmembrane component T [Syntrophales bacterium]
MKDNIPPFLLLPSPSCNTAQRGGRVKQPMIDKGIRRFSALVVSLSREKDTVSMKGLLQVMDARVKILFLVFFIVIISLKQTILHEVAIAAVLFLLTLFSRILPARFYLRIGGFTFFFGFLMALPATLNVITPGDIIVPVFAMSQSHDFWIYHIPRQIGFTAQGINAMAMLCLRVMNSLTLSLLVLYTTPLSQIIRALKVFRIPAPFLLIVNLSLKYIVVFSRYIEDMYLSRKSRSLTTERGEAARMWIAGRIAYLFLRTERRYEEIYRAMTARGYTQDYRPAPFAAPAPKDLFALGAFGILGLAILML